MNEVLLIFCCYHLMIITLGSEITDELYTIDRSLFSIVVFLIVLNIYYMLSVVFEALVVKFKQYKVKRAYTQAKIAKEKARL